MAARVGIEPTNGGFKVLCLTTWRPGNGHRIDDLGDPESLALLTLGTPADSDSLILRLSQSSRRLATGQRSTRSHCTIVVGDPASRLFFARAGRNLFGLISSPATAGSLFVSNSIALGDPCNGHRIDDLGDPESLALLTLGTPADSDSLILRLTQSLRRLATHATVIECICAKIFLQNIS